MSDAMKYEHKTLKQQLNNCLCFQEFIESVKAGKRADAVKYARKHLNTDEPEHLELVKQVPNKCSIFDN